MSTPPRCPRCRRGLDVVAKPGTTSYACPTCAGRAVTVGALKRFAPPERVRAMWSETWRGAPGTGVACPFCARPTRTVTLEIGAAPLVLDACRGCEAIWFDAGELAAFSPARQEPPPKDKAPPPDARRALAESIADETARTGREEHRAGWVRGPQRGGLAWLADALRGLV